MTALYRCCPAPRVYTSDDMRGALVLRIEAGAFGTKLDPIEAVAAELLRFLVSNFSLHEEKSALVVDRLNDLFQAAASDRASEPLREVGRESGIRDAKRIHHYGVHLDAHGERLTVAVVDCASRSLDFYVTDLLGIGVFAVLVVVEDLKINQAEHDEMPQTRQTRAKILNLFSANDSARGSKSPPWKNS